MALGHKHVWFAFGFLLIVLAIGATWPVISQFIGGTRSAPQINAEPALNAPSPYIAAQLERSIGASNLISYTNEGFEPTELTISQGSAVRFTNSSSGNLWVKSSGAAAYPEEGDCEATAFDSCYAVPPNEFWEFTFMEPGTWAYENSLKTENQGVIHVTAQ